MYYDVGVEKEEQGHKESDVLRPPVKVDCD